MTDSTQADATRAGLLHHVERYVADFDATVAFWDWLLGELGYDKHQQWDGGRSWKLGPTYLVLVDAPNDHQSPKTGFHRRQPGLNHLAFHAESRKHVDELTRKLRARDATILYEDDHPHAGGSDHYAVYFEDPERLKVELVAPN